MSFGTVRLELDCTECGQRMLFESPWDEDAGCIRLLCGRCRNETHIEIASIGRPLEPTEELPRPAGH